MTHSLIGERLLQCDRCNAVTCNVTGVLNCPVIEVNNLGVIFSRFVLSLTDYKKN